MATAESKQYRGSISTWPELRIYPQDGLDPYVLGRPHTPAGYGEGFLGNGLDIVSLSVLQTMEGSSMSASFRSSAHFDMTEFDSTVGVGDWFDVVWHDGAKTYHVMRGRLMSIHRSIGAKGGATSFDLSVEGMGFESCYKDTEIFSDLFADKTLAPIIWGQIATDMDLGTVLLDHAQAVTAALYGYAKSQQQAGRALWNLPVSMPSETNLLDAILLPHMAPSYGNSLLSRKPQRLNYLALNLRTPTPMGRSVWEAVKAWADPEVCDLFPTLVNVDGLPLGEEESSPETTRMAFVYRDKPFPNLFKSSGWFDSGDVRRVATLNVESRDVHAVSTTRSLHGLVNAVYVTPSIPNKYQSLLRYLTRPSWSTKSMAQFGVQKKEVLTPFIFPDAEDLVGANLLIADAYRRRIVELNALNHILESGNVHLARPRFDARPGQRLRVGGLFDMDAHIDGVSMSWSSVGGAPQSSVTLSVSRVWYGTTEEQVAALKSTLDEFEDLGLTDEPIDPTDPWAVAVQEALAGKVDIEATDFIGPPPPDELTVSPTIEEGVQSVEWPRYEKVTP